MSYDGIRPLVNTGRELLGAIKEDTIDRICELRFWADRVRGAPLEAIPRKYTILFPNSSSTAPVPGGGLMSSFSSYGPTYDMHLKPAFSAPGGSILSTFPVPLGSYAIPSGTSMATPFVAGSAALLLEARGKGKDTARAARSIFQNTAIPVKETTNQASLIETAAHQGAGLLNVYDAVKNTGSLTPAEILLNDTAYFSGTHTLELRNGGKGPVTYTLTHVPAGTVNTISGIMANPGPVPLVNNAATITFSADIVVVPAGATIPIYITVEAPTGLDPATFPVYSGYIKATGSDHTVLQSTYLGVAAKLKDAKVLDNTDTYFGVKLPLITDSTGNPVPPEGSVTYTMNGSDTPALIYRLVQGTPLMRVDLLDSKTKVTTNQRRSSQADIKPTKRCEDPKGPYSILDWLFPSKDKHCGGTFANIETRGVLYQEDYLPRNSLAGTADDNGYSSLVFFGFANGTDIPNGSYKILVRALKITGDAQAEEEYEVWTSPTIEVKRN